MTKSTAGALLSPARPAGLVVVTEVDELLVLSPPPPPPPPPQPIRDRLVRVASQTDVKRRCRMHAKAVIGCMVPRSFARRRPRKSDVSVSDR